MRCNPARWELTLMVQAGRVLRLVVISFIPQSESLVASSPTDFIESIQVSASVGIERSVGRLLRRPA